MTTLNLQVSASLDDAVETNTGTVSPLSGLCVIGEYSTYRHTGMRFTGVSGLSGVTILSAILTFNADATSSNSYVATMYAHDAAAPEAFTATAYNITDIAQRPRTTASVGCGSAQLGAWTIDQNYTLAVTTIIQELADSYDPNTIVMLAIYASGTGERLWESWNGDAAFATKLDITYTAPGGDATMTAALPTATALAQVAAIIANSTLVAALTAATAQAPAAEITAVSAGTILASLATASAGSPMSTWTANAIFSAAPAMATAQALSANIISGGFSYPQSFEVVQIDRPAEYGSDALFYLEVIMYTTNASQAARAKLRNVTDGTDVAGSDISTTSTTQARVRSSGFGLSTGIKEYRVDLGGDTGGTYIFNAAKILGDW